MVTTLNELSNGEKGMMRLKISLILFLSFAAVSASGYPGGFCSTGMAGSEDQPFIISKYVSGYSGNPAEADMYFRDTERIFQDYIEREHGYERSDASCYKYAEADTAVKERDKWIEFWEKKGREIIPCDC